MTVQNKPQEGLMQHLPSIKYVTHPETGKVYALPAGGADDGAAGGEGSDGDEGAGSGSGSGDGSGAGEGGNGDGADGAGAGTGSGTGSSGSGDGQSPPWGSDEEFTPDRAWRLIQNLRTEVSELKPMAAKGKEAEDADKTELQRATERADGAEERATKAEIEVAKLTAAVKHELTEEDLELLGDHGTPEEIEERAEKLAARLATAQNGEGTGRPASRRQGGGGAQPKPSVAAGSDLYAERKNKKT